MRPSKTQTAVPRGPFPRHCVVRVLRCRGALPLPPGAAPQGQAGWGLSRSARHSRNGSDASQRVPVLAGRSPSRKARACAAARPATAVASPRSQAGSGCGAPERHWASSRGRTGSRSVRSSWRQRAQAVPPGSTSGPTVPVASTTPAYRCGVPVEIHRWAGSGSGTYAPRPSRGVTTTSESPAPSLPSPAPPFPRPARRSCHPVRHRLRPVRGRPPRPAAAPERRAPRGPPVTSGRPGAGRPSPGVRRRPRTAGRPAPSPRARPGPSPAPRPGPRPPRRAGPPPSPHPPRAPDLDAQGPAGRQDPRRPLRRGMDHGQGGQVGPERIEGRARRPGGRPRPPGPSRRGVREESGRLQAAEERLRRPSGRPSARASARSSSTPRVPSSSPSTASVSGPTGSSTTAWAGVTPNWTHRRLRQARRSAGFTIGCISRPVRPRTVIADR